MTQNMKQAATKYNPSPQVILNLHRFTLVVAWCVTFFGIIGVLGWALNISPFRFAFPNTSHLKLNTFLYLIASGVVFAILRLNIEEKRQYRLILLPMTALLLIWLLTFMQAMGDVSPNIDLITPYSLNIEMLFSSDSLVLAAPVSMFFMALSFLLVVFNRFHWLRQALAFIVILVSLTTIISYLYTYQVQHTLWVYGAMTLPIALSFSLLSVCLFMIRPKTQLMRMIVDAGVGGVLLRRMLLTIIATPVVIGFLVIIGERLEVYDMMVAIILLVISTVIFFASMLIVNANFIHNVYQRHLNMSEQNRLQANMLQNVNDAVIASDKNLRIMSWNSAAEKIYGWSEAEVLGKTVRETLAVEVTEGITTDESRQALISNGQWKGESLQKRRDGSKIYVYTSVSSIMDEKGAHIGYVAVNRDITEYKRLREEAYEAELQKIAISAERETIKMREVFLATVSHDFRNPISVITTSTNILMTFGEKLNAEKRKRYLTQIQELGFYMGKLLDNALDYNRIKSKKHPVTPEKTNLKEFARHLFEQIQMTDKSNLHTFIFESEGDVTNALLDRFILQRILTNLLANSIKYSPTGGEIKLTVKRELDKVLFYVSDQGIGIPEQDMAMLFEPFHRADNAHYVEGMGLGMAIVQEHIKLCEGDIHVESVVGEGTTITVEIPYQMGYAAV